MRNTGNGRNAEPKMLGVRVEVTVYCRKHRSHGLVVRGPYLEVIEFLRVLGDVCQDRGRWAIYCFTPLEDAPGLHVGEWE